MKPSHSKKSFTSDQKSGLMSLLLNSLFMITVIFAMAGCEKENEEPPFPSYLRMTVEGERVECDYDIGAKIYAPSQIDPSVLNIHGMWKQKTLQEGYIEFILYDFDDVTGLQSFIYPSSVQIIKTHINEKMGIHNQYYMAEGKDVKLIVEEVSERYIKGIFELTAKMDMGSGTIDSLVITEGEFHIALKQ